MALLDDKDVYAEAGQLLRHYLRLSWRDKLLGRYVAIVAGLAVAVAKYSGQYRTVRPGLAGSGVLITLLFWQLDRRNRELFDRCINAGVGQEGRVKVDGAFTAISKPSRTLTY